MDDGANSTLSIAKVRKKDSGNYTCSIGPNDFYTITVHVLNGINDIFNISSLISGFLSDFFFNMLSEFDWFPGESLAELYHGKSAHIIVNNKYCILMLLLLAFYKIINVI